MTTFKDIIDRFQTAESLAREIGEKGVTVRQWRNRGSIPSRYWPAIIDASTRCTAKAVTVDELLKAQSAAKEQAA